MFRAAVITASDKGATGERIDESGPAIADFLARLGGHLISQNVVPDERETIADCLRSLCDNDRVDVILTTGGTGFSKRDVTPEATMEVIERTIPGFTEVIRIKSFDQNPRSILSRGVAGIRGNSIIINLPGSPGGVREALEIIGPALLHGIDVLKGQAEECGAPENS